MARAPEYEPGRITPRPLPSARLSAGATPGAFGATEARQIADAGAALGDVSDLGAQVALSQQKKYNSTTSRDVLNNATKR